MLFSCLCSQRTNILLIWFQIPHCNFPLKDHHLLSFDAVSKKHNHKHLKGLFKFSCIFQPCICMKPGFLHILKPEHHNTTNWTQKQLWGSSCPPASQTLKRLAKKCKTTFPFVFKSMYWSHPGIPTEMACKKDLSQGSVRVWCILSRLISLICLANIY